MIVYVNEKPPKPKESMTDVLGFDKINKNIKRVMNDIKEFHNEGKIGRRFPFPFNMTTSSLPFSSNILLSTPMNFATGTSASNNVNFSGVTEG